MPLQSRHASGPLKKKVVVRLPRLAEVVRRGMAPPWTRRAHLLPSARRTVAEVTTGKERRDELARGICASESGTRVAPNARDRLALVRRGMHEERDPEKGLGSCAVIIIVSVVPFSCALLVTLFADDAASPDIGFCSRGANCKYLHSSDMIMGGGGGANGFPGGPRMGPMGPMGPMPMGPGFMNGPFPGQGFPMQGSPPGQPGPSMQPYGVRPPMGSPMGPLRADSPGQRPGSQPPVNGAPESLQGEGPSLASRISTAPSSVGQGETPSPPMPMGAPAGFMGAPEQGFGGGQSRIVAPGGGRGRGGRPGHFQSNRRSQTTLVIENVPQEHLDLVKVNEYFKKFGTITNISIDAANSKALVSYSMPAEAKRAHESPDVIFGNRFVKVYFQRLDEPAPDASAAPPPQKPGFVPGQTPNVYHARPPTAPAQASSGPSEERKKQMAAMVELQKQKQELLNRQIGEQKALMEKLDGKKNMDPEERKGIMQALRKLGDEIKANTAAAKETAAAASSVASSKASPAPSGASHVTSNAADGAKSQSWKEQREQKERERLDRELELHAKGSAPGSTTEELKAKLEALKAEVSARAPSAVVIPRADFYAWLVPGRLSWIGRVFRRRDFRSPASWPWPRRIRSTRLYSGLHSLQPRPRGGQREPKLPP